MALAAAPRPGWLEHALLVELATGMTADMSHDVPELRAAHGQAAPRQALRFEQDAKKLAALDRCAEVLLPPLREV
jgi:hypothetical protein